MEGNSSSTMRSAYIVEKFKKDLEKTGIVLLPEVEGMLRKCIDESDQKFLLSNPTSQTEKVGTSTPVSKQSALTAIVGSLLRKKVGPLESQSQAKVASVSAGVADKDSSGGRRGTTSSKGGRWSSANGKRRSKRRAETVTLTSSESSGDDWTPNETEKKKRTTKGRVIRKNDIIVNVGMKKVKLESDWADPVVKTEHDQDSWEDSEGSGNEQQQQGNSGDHEEIDVEEDVMKIEVDDEEDEVTVVKAVSSGHRSTTTTTTTNSSSGKKKQKRSGHRRRPGTVAMRSISREEY